MSRIAKHLLPDTAIENKLGRLEIGGCDLVELAEKFGTPVFVYDEEHLRARCREAVKVFGKNQVVYATKAFLCGAMAKLAHEEGLLLDVATGGELFVVLHAGVPGSACVLHGNNKSIEELKMALDAKVHHIVVDNFDELDRIDELHRQGFARARIQLRITPGVAVHTHEFVSTGQDDSKFGFNLRNGDAQRAVDRVRSSASVEFVGIHCHIGSNVFAAENFEQAAEIMVNFANQLEVAELTLGGGLGVAYVENEHAPTITQWAKALAPATAKLRAGTKVFVEPGRAIVASAAVTMYRIGSIKNLPGIRTYVAVDGGMSDNPRPVLYDSGYEAFLPARVNDDRTEHARIVGKHCESGDVLIDDALLPVGYKVGDIIATPVTGAYGHSMGSNYNKVTRPPVVFVSKGSARVVVRRETFIDLVNLDVADSV
ncbi:MAG: diaminopimelate decarboxylase [Actinomycetota bacterium]